VEFVIAVAAFEQIVPVATLQPVVARAATEEVHAIGFTGGPEFRISVQRVVPLATIEKVMTVATVEVVAAGVAVEPVVATTTEQIVVTGTSREQVVAVSRGGRCAKHLVEGHADHEAVGGE
jgi:hypothetical protein